MQFERGQLGPSTAPALWGEVKSGMRVGEVGIESSGLLLPDPKAGAVPYIAGGGGASLSPPEHLSLAGGGSYFWSFGTRVGGSAQLRLQCKSFTTLPHAPHHGDHVSHWSLPRVSKTCHRHGPGPLPTTSRRLLAWLPSLLWSVNRSFGDTGPMAFEAGSWPLTMFQKSCAKALRAGLNPGFSPSAPLSQAGMA